ncbi:MAG: cupin domain-containing protein [Defluviitaleaceae bacterium]|nr:cupin domain-containing protein [Defluviitaleaceae bacterium]
MPPRPPAPFTDYGPFPYVTNIREATLENSNYRQALWTGKYLQNTLMSIPPGGDIGLEIHPDTDQFLRIEDGQGIVQMGESRNHLNFRQPVLAGYGIFIPAGTWHNVTNVGTGDLRLYSIYAPPHHPHGTIHPTKAIAERMGD